MAKKARFAFKRIVKFALGFVLIALIVAIFYIAVVLGHPQEGETAAALPDQPLLPASPAVNITQESELTSLMGAFPAPVMSFLPGSGLTLAAGSSYDMAFEDGFARIVSLNYTTEWNQQQVELRVESIYPARAISLIPKADYHIGAVAGQSLAGLQSVRMENSGSIRFHAQAADALYVLTVPKSAADDLSSLTRSLQIVTVESGQ